MRRFSWSALALAALLAFLSSPCSWAQEPPLLSPISPQADSARPSEMSLNSKSATSPLYEDSNELLKMADEYEEMSSGLRAFLKDMAISQADSDLSVSESLKLLKESTPILQDLKQNLKRSERKLWVYRIGAGALAILSTYLAIK